MHSLTAAWQRSLRGVPRALNRVPGYGHLCRAKACCLACWRGNLPDYDILVKCVLREQAACRKCSGDGKRSVSLSNPLQKTTSQLYRAATRVFQNQTPACPCALAFAFSVRPDFSGPIPNNLVLASVRPLFVAGTLRRAVRRTKRNSTTRTRITESEPGCHASHCRQYASTQSTCIPAG